MRTLLRHPSVEGGAIVSRTCASSSASATSLSTTFGVLRSLRAGKITGRAAPSVFTSAVRGLKRRIRSPRLSFQSDWYLSRRNWQQLQARGNRARRSPRLVLRKLMFCSGSTRWSGKSQPLSRALRRSRRLPPLKCHLRR